MNHLEIEDALIGNGLLIRENKRNGKSLSKADRGVILKYRRMAFDAGFNRLSINIFELEGERGVNGMVMPQVTARFIGAQRVSRFVAFRLYNIEGDHKLNNSTVSISTLVREGVTVPDLNAVQVFAAIVVESYFSVECAALDVYFKLKKALGGK